MTGFDQKVLHLQNHGSTEASVTVEVDPRGDGSFGAHHSLTVAPGALSSYVFPAGFSAHWLRLVSAQDAVVTGQLFYT